MTALEIATGKGGADFGRGVLLLTYDSPGDSGEKVVGETPL
jgi:hypothetical protein